MLRDSQKHFFYSDLTLADSIRGFVEELDIDGVSSFGVWATGRHGFGLTDGDLEAYARRSIAALLAAGAVPAMTSLAGPDFFVPLTGYQGSHEAIIEKIIREWKVMGRDPDHGWLWFFRFSK